MIGYGVARGNECRAVTERLPSNTVIALSALATLGLPSVRARLGPTRHAAQVGEVTAAAIGAARGDGLASAGHPGQAGAAVPGPGGGARRRHPPTPKFS